jgi:hypothetical protein
MPLLSLERPCTFVPNPEPISEEALFDEISLGVLRARQSTNYRGHREIVLGPAESAQLTALMKQLDAPGAPILDHAAYSHVCLGRPYRTPFTMLLTLIGHKPILSLLTVPIRAYRKRVHHDDDIPTIGYLRHLHIGIWAEALELAAPIASEGHRRANVIMAPFCPGGGSDANAEIISKIEALCGITPSEHAKGWRVRLVAQVGQIPQGERLDLPRALWRKLGGNLLAMRSERIQPGVNHESKAPAPYQRRQDMDVPDELTVMAGRAAYNAFAHWANVDREKCKDLLLLERIDVLTPGGKERLRAVRGQLETITESVIRNLPWWADLPTGRAFSRNARRGKKAFALAGQRVYIAGLDPKQVADHGIGWSQAVTALGAAAARSALVAELMGCVEIPSDCDLLAGICLMAGPVNQNDIGKQFYGEADLLASAFPDRDPCSLLVWTLKAKTVADPVGNEEQLMNPDRKGALVDLRPGPHEVVDVIRAGARHPMRDREGKTSRERAYADVGNFVVDAHGTHIPGNQGEAWPEAWRKASMW